MCASHWVDNKPKGVLKVKAASCSLREILFGAHQSTVRILIVNFVRSSEHTRWDPKDGELCLNWVKPGETLVEVRSDSDVQIDRQIWV
jgi:hypothetical protein